MIIAIHTAFGVVALVAGAWNLAARKGTRRHRRVGWVYVASMAGLLLTSFFIFELFGGFGPFHAMSLLSGGTLAIALYYPLRREKHAGWVEAHYFWIAYSYVGLVMATGSHLFDYLPEWSFWTRAALFWGLPYAVGSALIFGWKARTLERAKRHTEAGRPA